jgi:cell cycle checkpoint protein
MVLIYFPHLGKPSFNPIAETYLRKALQNILARAGVPSPGSEALELVIATANGDIRSAINALEFACGTSMSIGSKGGDKGKRKGHSSRMLLESVTRREQSMALFHLIGRILYNKRKLQLVLLTRKAHP